MICSTCDKDRPSSDFFKQNGICYTCESRLKLQNCSNKKILCRSCKKEITLDKSIKKRQRTVFCSLECAKKGHKEINKNYWTRKTICTGVV